MHPQKGMRMDKDDKAKRLAGEIVYHFDVDRHSIPLKQFVDTARSSQAVIDDFNEQLFDKKVRFELRVRTPETGGLMEVLGLVILGGGGSILAFLGTDIGKAFFKGLTGEEPAHWAKKLGENTRKLLSNDDHEHSALSTAEVEPIPAKIISDDVELQADLLVELLISFLAANTDKLEKIGITPAKFRKAFAAKNAIYKACIDNSEIKGLSFDRSYDFPLKRADFPRLITQIPDEVQNALEEIQSWSVETVDILVNSPNWKRDGRKWQAATDKFQDIAFSLEDETFWLHVKKEDIQPHIGGDNMRVQWAYPQGLSKPSHVRVLRVLTYNGNKISDPLSDAELQAELQEAHVIEPDVPDLFDHKTNNPNNEGDEGKP